MEESAAYSVRILPHMRPLLGEVDGSWMQRPEGRLQLTGYCDLTDVLSDPAAGTGMRHAECGRTVCGLTSPQEFLTRGGEVQREGPRHASRTRS